MFKRAKVLEYISDLNNKSSFKNKYKEIVDSTSLKISPDVGNSLDLIDHLVDNFPVGTILAKNYSNQEDNYIICLPFFSSHLSLPVKPGEMVWYFTDGFDIITNEEFIENNPIQSFNSFWMSRIHGVVLNEDTNYTHYEKIGLVNTESDNVEELVSLESGQANDKKKFKKDKDEISKNISVPSFKEITNSNEKYKEDSNFFGFFADDSYKINLESTKKIFDNKKRKSFFPSAVPRYNSKPDELTLQGSNNTIISLNHNVSSERLLDKKMSLYELRDVTGNIDIVSGRHLIKKYHNKTESDVFLLEDKIKANIDSKEKKNEPVKFDKKIGFYYIENESGEIENLKIPKVYLGENNVDFQEYQSVEGVIDIRDDASTIKVSERRKVDDFLYEGFSVIQNVPILNVFSQKNIDLISDKKSKDFSSEIPYEFLPTIKNIKINNKTSFDINNQSFESIEQKKIENQELPSVLIKSNDIRLVSRKSFVNNLNEAEPFLSEGSLRLVKESNNFLSHAHICLENDGNILVDGNTILLGNINKEYLRQNINLESRPPSVNDFKEMHGKGLGLLIGYDEMLSEPLVLGETLKSVLSELITINGLLLDELKKITDHLSEHIHEAAVPGGFTMFPDVLAKDAFNSSGSKIDGDIRKRFEDVQSNLRFILSRFAKTSWWIIIVSNKGYLMSYFGKTVKQLKERSDRVKNIELSKIVSNNIKKTPVGIKTPLENSNKSLFKMHYSIDEQIADNLRCLLMTRKGERLGFSDFGVDLNRIYADRSLEQSDVMDLATNQIQEAINKYMPSISLVEFYSEKIDNSDDGNKNNIGRDFATAQSNISVLNSSINNENSDNLTKRQIYEVVVTYKIPLIDDKTRKIVLNINTSK